VAVWFATRHRAGAAPSANELFAIERITRLTTTGTANVAALSPDGRYVTHVKVDDAGQSLWIRQTATASDVRIMPSAAVRYDGLTFSPDGNFVYYVTYGAAGAGVASLYRIPALGGTPEMVLEDIDSAVTFSPDARRIAFARGDPARGKGSLIVANVDGSGQRVLTEGEAGFVLQNEAPAWSPDGRTILAGVRPSSGAPSVVLCAVDASDGTIRRVGEPWALFRNVQWLPSGRSFLIDGIEPGATHSQIWQEDYPSGTLHRVTNDLNRYVGLSVSADGHSVVTVQLTRQANIWSLDPARGQWQRLTTGASADGADGLAVLPDDRIVYGSDAAGAAQIFIMDADGANRRQLTNVDGRAANPSGAPDGSWIAFAISTRSGGGIYRMGSDGTGLRELTRGAQDSGPVVSPDGKWVYYTTIADGQPHAMKIGADGGNPVPLATANFRVGLVMPGGTTLLGVSWNQARRQTQTGTMSVNGGPVTLLDLPLQGRVSADGRSYIYPDPPFAATKILSRPMGGGPVAEVARVSGELFFNGAPAADGKLIVSRGTALTDVVLISAAAGGRRD
jgi:Tol biopolymer transport system component